MKGHGHVTPNEDGSKARCKGLSICPECALELARKGKTGKVNEAQVDADRRANFNEELWAILENYFAPDLSLIDENEARDRNDLLSDITSAVDALQRKEG